MIPTSDLRKGNLVKTEYGILPVHAIVWNSIMVKGNDERVLWAKEVEGVDFKNNIKLLSGEQLLPKIKNWIDDEVHYQGIPGWRDLEYIHEAQNLFYWLFKEELIVKVNE